MTKHELYLEICHIISMFDDDARMKIDFQSWEEKCIKEIFNRGVSEGKRLVLHELKTVVNHKRSLEYKKTIGSELKEAG